MRMWVNLAVRGVALAGLGLATLAALAPVHASAQPDPRYANPPGNVRPGQIRRAAPGEVIYLAPPTRGQRLPPQVRYAPPPPQGGFRIPFLDRLFGGGRAAEPPPQASGRMPGMNAGGAAPGAAGRAAQPPRPKVEPKYFVAVIGDGLAEAVANGLDEALADRPDIALVRRVTPEQGLVGGEPPFATTVRDFLGSGRKIDAAVMAIGLKDQRPIDEARIPHAFRSTRWNQLYATRIDEVLIALTERRLPVVWLGLPPVADEGAGSGNAHMNEILRQRLIGFGASFHDVWDGFVDDNDAYAASGPSLDGRAARLRLADGVGFTRAGARKYAHYAEVEIRRLFPLGKENGEGPGVAAARTDASIHVVTSAPRTPGGTLLSAELPAIRRAASASPQAVPPGRADDFRWPPGN